MLIKNSSPQEPTLSFLNIYYVLNVFNIVLNQYITFDRDPSSTTFGAETYYGQDFFLKTKNAKLFVFNALLPFRDKQDKESFKMEKSKIANYRNIGTYAKLIEEFECDLHSASLVPVALAQKYSAISLEPGGKVLDLLAQASFK